MGRRWWDCVDFWSDCSVNQPPTGSLADDDDDGGRIPADVFRPGFCYRCPITDSPPTRADLSPFISPRALVILTGGLDTTTARHMCTSGCVCYRIVIRRRRSKSEATIFSKFPIPFTIVQHSQYDSVSSFWRWWWWSSFRHRHLRRRRRHLHTRTTPLDHDFPIIHPSIYHPFTHSFDAAIQITFAADPPTLFAV